MHTSHRLISSLTTLLAFTTLTLTLALPTDIPTDTDHNTTLAIRTDQSDPLFWMAPLSTDEEDEDQDEDSSSSPNLAPRHGAGNPPDSNSPSKVWCNDFESITDETSNGSPFINDCLRIIPNIAPPDHSADWKFMIGRTRQLVKYGTCVLAVSANDDKMHKGSWAKVGNMDVIGVLEELADMRGDDGKGHQGWRMGGKTKGRCMINVLKKPTTVEFSVFHT